MNILQNISLKPYNSFGIEATAAHFSSFSSIDELASLLEISNQQYRLILGGGSNILLTKNIDGYVLKNELKGIEKVHEDENHFYIKANAGENWHGFVMHCIENNYAGLENLSLIPGNVGASPMQNIGAYGVEIKDVFHSLEAYDIQDKKIVQFTLNDCEFGYRESVFKTRYKNRFVILSVTYRLNKKPVYHVSYGAIKQQLEIMGITELSIKAISNAVIQIRTSKLPDPKQTGNAGSFFKNPVIEKEQLTALSSVYPDIPFYPASAPEQLQTHVKIAAGWLIEKCGWKGYRNHDAGCHAKQALVLVNYGNAKGSEIFNLSEEIISSVNEKFGILLEREVNII